jgi:hypothetical protein
MTGDPCGLLGNIPFVAHNLEYLVMAVVVVSVIPAFLPLLRRGAGKESYAKD